MAAKKLNDNINQPLAFEVEAKKHFPSLRKRVVKVNNGKKFEYKVYIKVPHYGARFVRIIFAPEKPLRVKADGPKQSKHRYDDGSLCMYYPKDEKDMTWNFDDGLLMLLRMIEAHLFREYYWRETGEWLGPEHDHSSVPKTQE